MPGHRRPPLVSTARRGGLAFVVSLALVLSLSVVTSAEGDPARAPAPVTGPDTAPTLAVAPAGALAVLPTDPMSGELLLASGRFPTNGRRPVVLQRKTGEQWANVSKGRTTSGGRYLLTTTMKWHEVQLRVLATALPDRLLDEALSDEVTRTAVPQAGEIVVPTTIVPDEKFVLTASFAPARRARAVTLQRHNGSKWKAVATGLAKANGTVSFKRKEALSDGVRYRAIAWHWAGARAFTTPEVTVRPGTRQSLELAVSSQPGNSLPLDLAPTLTSVASFVPGQTEAGAPRLLSDGGSGVVVDVPAGTAPGSRTLRGRGVGCAGDSCNVYFTLTVTLEVVGLGAGATPEDFTEPSQDRISQAVVVQGPVSRMLDEALLTMGTDVAPGSLAEAQAAAASVSATVTGALNNIGVFEIRWAVPPADFEAALEVLRAYPGVASAEPSLVGGLGATEIPSDWSDDGDAIRWPFTQMRAPQAWEISAANHGSDTTVGIVDSSRVLSSHEDLNVVSATGGLGKAEDGADHGTHVAGLACARSNNKGVVGAAWGCPIVSAGLAGGTTRYTLHKTVLPAAEDVVAGGARVVNMSLGYNDVESPGHCSTQAVSDSLNKLAQESSATLRRLFNSAIGRDVVWTLAAGNNCAEGTHSPMGVSWALPNVITVAASNSDGTLARFSNAGPGIEVAAGGGVGIGIPGGQGGPISTVFTDCGLFGNSKCAGYGGKYGTSMAAPLVAGVAAMARSASPGRSAAEIGSCITTTAGTNTGTVTTVSPEPSKFPRKISIRGSVPIVDAEAAVKCAQTGPTNGDILIAGAGDRTASGNGTDRGDLFAALVADGKDVASADSLPANLAGFGQIWYLDTVAATSDEQDRLAAFVSSGRGLYLTGEWGCCTVDQSSIALINRLVPGANVSHGGTGGDSIAIGPLAPFSLGSAPNSVSSIKLAAPGTLSGVDPGNVVGSNGDGRAVVAAWPGSQVTGGGRIAIVMDINWVAGQYRGASWDDFVENLSYFLAHGA